MSGIREIPNTDFINNIVALFYPNPDLRHIIEIHISRLNQDLIAQQFIEFYPELELYYYPSKLQTMLTNDTITFSSCICILRQLLRKSGFTVLTKTIKKRSSKEKILIIYPPLQ